MVELTRKRPLEAKRKDTISSEPKSELKRLYYHIGKEKVKSDMGRSKLTDEPNHTTGTRGVNYSVLKPYEGGF